MRRAFKCADPLCSRSRQFYLGCALEHCCKKCAHYEGKQHEEDCDVAARRRWVEGRGVVYLDMEFVGGALSTSDEQAEMSRWIDACIARRRDAMRRASWASEGP